MKERMSVWVILAVVCFVVSSVPAWAASGSSKVGYFELQTIIQQSQWGKRSNDDFKKEQDAVKAEVDHKLQAFKTAKEEFDKKRDVLDEKARTKKMQELAGLQADTEKFVYESNQKMNKRATELRGPLIDKIMEIVRKLAKDDKYDFVFEREQAGLICVDEKTDLSKRVIDELDRSKR
jgi:outer membrane protein